jgi:hypothetical protein
MLTLAFYLAAAMTNDLLYFHRKKKAKKCRGADLQET